MDFLSFEDIQKVEKLLPEIQDKFFFIKSKKVKKILNELDDQLAKLRLILEARESILKDLLYRGVCHQHYESITSKIYRDLAKIRKVEKKKDGFEQ